MQTPPLSKELIHKGRAHYDCELNASDILEAMSHATSRPALAEVVQKYIETVENNRHILSQIFRIWDTSKFGGRCLHSERFVLEITDIIWRDADPLIKDFDFLTVLESFQSTRIAEFATTFSLVEKECGKNATDLFKEIIHNEKQALERTIDCAHSLVETTMAIEHRAAV